MGRRVVAWTALSEHRMGVGFSAWSLRSQAEMSLDPVLNIDEFNMSEPTFPPHPHAGFSAVTYLFEDSPGAFINRDSLGDRSRIGPGSLHWTQAGRGMMHEEIPEQRGQRCHGIQMFVNLSEANKHAAPRAFHLDAPEIPEVALGGARVRVVAGALGDTRSPLQGLLTPILLLDVILSPDTTVEIPVPRGNNVVVMSRAGSGEIGPIGATRPLAGHQAARLSEDGDTVRLSAGEAGLALIVVGGQPIGEPVVFGGPFIMTNPADLQAARARFTRGEMGRLSPSF